jgi:hypothetical protein
MDYVTSDAEIKRRKLAYLSLSISLVVGTFISSAIYQFSIPIVAYLVLLSPQLERWYVFRRTDWINYLEYPEWTNNEVNRFLHFDTQKTS